MAELHFGVVARTADARALRVARLSRVQRRFAPLPVDEAVAESYEQIAAHVAAAGQQPRARTMDLLIAATAHAHGAVLCTRNADDFRGLEFFVEVVTASGRTSPGGLRCRGAGDAGTAR